MSTKPMKCDPPLSDAAVRDLINYVDKRVFKRDDEGEILSRCDGYRFTWEFFFLRCMSDDEVDVGIAEVADTVEEDGWVGRG